VIKCITIDNCGYEELNIETPIQEDDFVDLITPIIQNSRNGNTIKHNTQNCRKHQTHRGKYV